MIIFDTETTGLSVEENQIAQLSYVKIDEKYEIEFAKNFYFSVEYMSHGAEEVNGLSKKLLEELSEGKRFEDFADEIYKDFSEDNLLISHNIKFDKEFLIGEFEISNKDISVFKSKEYFCTMEYYTDILEIHHDYYITKYPRLSEVIRYLNIDKNEILAEVNKAFKIENTRYHDARFDVIATYLIYKYRNSDFERYNNIKSLSSLIFRVENNIEYLKNMFKRNEIYDISIKDLNNIENFIENVNNDRCFNDYKKTIKECFNILNDISRNIEAEEERIKKKKEIELKNEIENVLLNENTVIEKGILLKQNNYGEIDNHVVFNMKSDYELDYYCENYNVDLVKINKNRYLMIDEKEVFVIEISKEASLYSIAYNDLEYEILSMEKCPEGVAFPDRAYEVKSYNSYLNLPESYYYKDIDKNKDTELKSNIEINYEPLDDDDIPF